MWRVGRLMMLIVVVVVKRKENSNLETLKYAFTVEPIETGYLLAPLQVQVQAPVLRRSRMSSLVCAEPDGTLLVTEVNIQRPYIFRGTEPNDESTDATLMTSGTERFVARRYGEGVAPAGTHGFRGADAAEEEVLVWDTRQPRRAVPEG